MMINEWEMIEAFSHLTVSAKPNLINGYLTNLTIQPDIMDQIRSTLQMDSRRNQWINENDQVKASIFKYRNGILRFQGRIYGSREQNLRQIILGKAHQAKYTVHPRTTKMYKDLKEVYWWPGIKNDVA